MFKPFLSHHLPAPQTLNQPNLHNIVNTSQLTESQNQQMPRSQPDEQLIKLHQQQVQQQQQQQLKNSTQKLVAPTKSPPKSPQISFVDQNVKSEKITMYNV